MKTLSLILVLAALAAAGEIGFGSAGPSQNLALYQAANQNPNATGSVSVTGANISESIFTFSPIEWTASLNVTSVIGGDTSNASLAVTNSVISLNAEGNFVTNTSWDSCLIVMQSVAHNATVKGQKDKGDCSAAFGEDCIEDWKSALDEARSAAAILNSTKPCGGMTFPSIPPSCYGSFEWDLASTDITYVNQTDGHAFFYSIDDAHDPSNTTAYEVAATRIWPIILMQNSVHFNGGGVTSAQLSCLRATNATEGSKKIGSVPGAASQTRMGVWGLLMTVGALWLLL